MEIVVLNGSPKGMVSVTMQYIHYIQKEFPQHKLKIFNITQKIRKIENDAQDFHEIIDEIRTSDGVLWASPVYYLLVPSNYKRFIELISERGVQNVFQNKHTAFLTTSIHFSDHTAHNYMQAICDDLDMRYVGSFSAEMHDLLKAKEREKLKLFSANFFDAIEKNAQTPKSYMPLTWRDFNYLPGEAKDKVDVGNKKVLIVTDSEDQQTNLIKMVERFKGAFANQIEVCNLHDLKISGSCLGCIQCGYDNKCIYEGKDDFINFFNDKVKTADILVWAGKIKDRYLSSMWKLFFDRSFFNGHAPSLIGKQIGFIISGPLTQIPNLRQILEAYVEMQRSNLGGFVTDEDGDSDKIDNLLQSLARNLVYFADKRYIKPYTFLGVGGIKVFRDDIWGKLRFPFRADYLAYKRLGVYDFPQRDYKTRIANSIMLAMSRLPRFRKEISKRMKSGMIQPFQKIFKD